MDEQPIPTPKDRLSVQQKNLLTVFNQLLDLESQKNPSLGSWKEQHQNKPVQIVVPGSGGMPGEVAAFSAELNQSEFYLIEKDQKYVDSARGFIDIKKLNGQVVAMDATDEKAYLDQEGKPKMFDLAILRNIPGTGLAATATAEDFAKSNIATITLKILRHLNTNGLIFATGTGAEISDMEIALKHEGLTPTVMKNPLKTHLTFPEEKVLMAAKLK